MTVRPRRCAMVAAWLALGPGAARAEPAPAELGFHSLDRVVGRTRVGVDGGLALLEQGDADGSPVPTWGLRLDLHGEVRLVRAFSATVELPTYVVSAGQRYLGVGPIQLVGYREVELPSARLFVGLALRLPLAHHGTLHGYDTEGLLGAATRYQRLSLPAVGADDRSLAASVDELQLGPTATLRWRRGLVRVQADLGATLDPTRAYDGGRDATDGNPLWLHAGLAGAVELGRAAVQLELVAVGDPLGGPSVLGQADGDDLTERVASSATVGGQYRAARWSAGLGLALPLDHALDQGPLIVAAWWHAPLAAPVAR